MTEETQTPPVTASSGEQTRQVRRQQKTGVVVSDKMLKTVVVEVEYFKKHRLYKKTIRQTSRFKAHDENNEYKTGDRVRIEETRPVSKDKCWRVVELIQKGDRA